MYAKPMNFVDIHILVITRVNTKKNAKSTIFMQPHRHAQSYSVLQSPFTRLSTLEGQVPFKARTYHPNF